MQITCFHCGGQNFSLVVVEQHIYDEADKKSTFETTELWCVNETCHPKETVLTEDD